MNGNYAIDPGGPRPWHDSILLRTGRKPATEFSDGTYAVGGHITPGTYRTSDKGELCYWERLSDFSHQFEGIIANGTDETVIKIKEGDTGFTSAGCGTWVQQ